MWQTKLENFTLLDIGGQDSKVISVKGGRMVDMMLNDKCALLVEGILKTWLLLWK